MVQGGSMDKTDQKFPPQATQLGWPIVGRVGVVTIGEDGRTGFAGDIAKRRSFWFIRPFADCSSRLTNAGN